LVNSKGEKMIKIVRSCVHHLKKVIKPKKPIQFRNKLTAKVYDVSGELVHTQTGLNTVTTGDYTVSDTYNGRVLMLGLLTNDNNSAAFLFNKTDHANPDYLETMQLGTGTPDNNGLGTEYTSPGTTQESFDTITWDVSTQSTPKVTLSTSWTSGGYGALSGITEAALETTQSDVFAYKTFSPALSKTAGGTITLEWELTLS
jgi:hypothetical protein